MKTQTTEVDRPTLTVYISKSLPAEQQAEIEAVVYDLDSLIGERLDVQHDPIRTAYIIELQESLGDHRVKWLAAVGAVYRYDEPMEHLAVVEQVRCTRNIEILEDVEKHFGGDVPAAVAEALSEAHYRLAVAV